MKIEEYDIKALEEPLLAWFAGSARSLPWREDASPYRVWVSEIMLQQTRVEAVKPYFERFVAELPDVSALAECEEERLLKLWEGLGYYNRVRNMKCAAASVMEDYDGSFPASYEELRKLKGIGSYTAGAVASIAFGIPVPAVDGNVLRALSRVAADDRDIAKQSVRRNMERRLLEVMPKGAAGAYNQALMELGATVCLPNGAPLCDACPWRERCVARRDGLTDRIPVKSRPAGRKVQERTVFLIRDGEKVALRKRPGRGLLAGMYEFPNETGYMSREEALAYVKALRLLPLHIEPLSDAKHVFSHVEWRMKGYAVRIEAPEEGGGMLFAEAADISKRYPVPSAFAAYTEYLNIPLGKKAVEEP